VNSSSNQAAAGGCRLRHDHVDAAVVHLGVAGGGGRKDRAADLEILQVGRVVGDAHRVGLAEPYAQVCREGAAGLRERA
jgi:hypothetical protein